VPQSERSWAQIPDVAIGIFHSLNPYGHSVALESTLPLTEMSTWVVSLGGKGAWCMGLTTLPPSCANCLEILGTSVSWNPTALSRVVMGLLCFSSNIRLKEDYVGMWAVR
jgi:hypothetical protein